MSKTRKTYDIPILCKSDPQGGAYLEWARLRELKKIEIPDKGTALVAVVHRRGFWSMVECWSGLSIDNKKLQRELGSAFRIEQFRAICEDSTRALRICNDPHNRLLSLIPEDQKHRIRPDILDYMQRRVWPALYEGGG